MKAKQSKSKIQISNVESLDQEFRFTLSNIETPYANALRRVILTEIPINVVRTESEEINQARFEYNTSRLHNEILKQRLSSIPIHNKALEKLAGKYTIECDVENKTDQILYVTTEDFQLKNKETGQFMGKEETRRIFPADPITHRYIDFCRLRPKISDTILGEKVKFSADISIATAKENCMFNVVSKCTYRNTPDPDAIQKEWEKREIALREQYTAITAEEVQFEKRNFEYLDAERFFVPDSFDFTIQSIGIYEEEELVKKACMVLHNKMVDFIKALADNEVPIQVSETSMDNCFDVVLVNEDYTMGKILEHVLYEMYWDVKDPAKKRLNYCAFKKYHPHFTESVIRLGFVEGVKKEQVRYVMKEAAVVAQEKVKEMYDLF